MKQVWKYTIKPGEQVVNMPRGAKPLSVALQRGEVQMWALVDPEEPDVDRCFYAVGTGHPIHINAELSPVGTVLMGINGPGDSLVFHVFEVL